MHATLTWDTSHFLPYNLNVGLIILHGLLINSDMAFIVMHCNTVYYYAFNSHLEVLLSFMSLLSNSASHCCHVCRCIDVAHYPV